jgi:hypothetical protein
MDVQDRLNELTAMVRSAKAMPMSGSCLVNRAEMLEILERMRKTLPANLHNAQVLLTDREAVLADARQQGQAILQAAHNERDQLIEQSDVLVAARARAAAVTTQAHAESARLLAEADGYVDGKLAHFEVVLGQLASQVSNGRQRLATRAEADLGDPCQAHEERAAGRAGLDDDLPLGAAESGRSPVLQGLDQQGPSGAGVSLPVR